jgi:hypothetical protein
MYNQVLSQGGGNEFIAQLVFWLIALYAFFIINLYIFRSIFNIPSFLRYQKAQIRLLEEIAKTQGVDHSKVKSIVSETNGWGEFFNQQTSSNAPVE